MIETIILIIIFIAALVFTYKALRKEIQDEGCGSCAKKNGSCKK